MIVLGNQLALQFAIADKTDFISIDKFKYMRIAENAGGLRPILDLTFELTDPDLVNYFNNGNVISLMYGIKEPTSDILQFEIMGDNKGKEYHVGSTVSILGAMYNRGFTNKVKTLTYYNRKSYQALNIIASQNNLKFVSNVTNTNDSQTWYQTGMKDWSMAQYIADRAYKDPSTFFSWGFDNNNLYFYDIRELLKKGPKWTLTTNSVGKNDNSPVVNIGTYSCDDSNAGINGDLAGRNITNVGFNLDTGEFSNPSYALKTFTTLDTKRINVNTTDCQGYNYSIITNDEHPSTIEAMDQNRRNNVLFSSYVCHVPIPGQYRDFRLFDVVQLIPTETDKEAEGFYFITGIARKYENNLYKTLLTLNRESANGIKGNLIGG